MKQYKSQTKHHHKITWKMSILSIIILISCLLGIYLINQTHANQLAQFKPGNIMSDFVMSNYTSMNKEQIQQFLKSKNHCNNRNIQEAKKYPNMRYNIRDGHFVCMADELFNGETAAHIIWQAAQDYKINPQVLIVLLEKEQSLITDTWPNHIQYQSATGYGCPDSTPGVCNNQFYGFKNQVRSAAKLFRQVLNGGWTNYPLGDNYIQYNPNEKCGGSIVRIENRATSALYRYTPYQPNPAAIAAGYGTVHCGAYGNRNFYLYFQKWFGPTNGSQLIRDKNGGVYLLEKNHKRPFPSSTIFLSYGYNFASATLVEQEELDRIPLGQPMSHAQEGKPIHDL